MAGTEIATGELIRATKPAGLPSNSSDLLSSEKKLRELLWLNHGCSKSGLYGDDGEMQCNNGENHQWIDFKRDSAEEIERKLRAT